LPTSKISTKTKIHKMTIQQFIAAGQSLPLDQLRLEANMDFVREIQNKLTALGILDPDTERIGDRDYGPKSTQDGRFGRNSRFMLEVFCQRVNIVLADALTPAIAEALSQAQVGAFLPMNLTAQNGDSTDTTIARRVLRYMKANGYWIAQHPNMINIVYLEGGDNKGQPNLDGDNEWNDRRLLIRIKPDGNPELLLNVRATTEPTIAYAQSQVRKNRRDRTEPFAARIAFGQYKAWIMGFHHRFSPRKKQPALQQVLPVLLHRDKDASGTRTRDDIMSLGVFGINQHSTRLGVDFPNPGSWSEGCLVGKDFAKHLEFLAALKTDIRYVKNTDYRFMSIVIDTSRLKREQP
jgi:hypothetical protein